MNFCLYSFLGTMEVREARHKMKKIKIKNVTQLETSFNFF